MISCLAVSSSLQVPLTGLLLILSSASWSLSNMPTLSQVLIQFPFSLRCVSWGSSDRCSTSVQLVRLLPSRSNSTKAEKRDGSKDDKEEMELLWIWSTERQGR